MRLVTSTLLGLAAAGLMGLGVAQAAVQPAPEAGTHWIFTAPNPEGNQARNQPANATKLGTRRNGLTQSYRGYRYRHHRRRHHR